MVTFLWSFHTLMGITMLIGRLGWKPSWNLLMKESGCLLKTAEKDQPLLLVNEPLPKRKQQALTVRLWMQYSMLFLWKNLRGSQMWRLHTLHGTSYKQCMKKSKRRSYLAKLFHVLQCNWNNAKTTKNWTTLGGGSKSSCNLGKC